MDKKIILGMIVLVMITAACVKSAEFEEGLQKLKDIGEKYGASTYSLPSDLNLITEMIDDIKELKKIQIEKDGREAFALLLDSRINFLEAEKYFLEDAEKYGEIGSTKKGFGCKRGRPRILNSTALRNESSNYGLKAADLMMELIEKYPDKAESSGVFVAKVYILNNSYTKIQKEALSDRKVLDNFCPEEKYIELIKEEELKEQMLS